jgi:hypothetical protein
MAWTKTTRKQYRRDGLRYASDTTAKEWILLSPLLPKRSHIGRPPEWHLPKDFPPLTTVQHYFYDWADQSYLGHAHKSGQSTPLAAGSQAYRESHPWAEHLAAGALSRSGVVKRCHPPSIAAVAPDLLQISPEGVIDLAFGTRSQNMELEPEGAGRRLQFSRLYLGSGSVRIHERSDDIRRGDQLVQQLQPLRS